MEHNAMSRLIRTTFHVDGPMDSESLTQELREFLTNQGLDLVNIFDAQSPTNVLVYSATMGFITMPPTNYFAGWQIQVRDNDCFTTCSFSYDGESIIPNETQINGLAALGLYQRVVEINRLEI